MEQKDRLQKLIEAGYPKTLKHADGCFVLGRDRKLKRFDIGAARIFKVLERDILGETLQIFLPESMPITRHDTLIDGTFSKFEDAIAENRSLKPQSMGTDSDGAPRVVTGRTFNGDPMSFSLQFAPLLDEGTLYVAGFLTSKENATLLVTSTQEESKVVIQDAKVNFAFDVVDAVGDRFDGGFKFLVKNVYGESRLGRIAAFANVTVFWGALILGIGYLAVEYFKKPPTSQEFNIDMPASPGPSPSGGSFTIDGSE